VENAKPERLRVLQREEGLESLVLHGRLTVVVLLEDVRAGDVLDLRFTVHTQHRIFPTHFTRLIPIPECVLCDFHLRVCFPTGQAMRWKSNDPKLTPTVSEQPPETEWSWHLSKLPGSEPEPNVPGWHFQYRWIELTDFASWAEVASGLAAAWQEDLQNPEVLRLVESIAAEASTPAGRAERALTFLQDEIRYLSVNTEFGGQVPTSPGVIIKRGFGDCKDKAFAAAHLLRLLGIPARPVLVNSDLRQAVEAYLPMPGAFNHAIVEYEIDGRRRWVDVTLPLQGGSLLSRPTAQFQLGLPLGPGVEDLEEIPSDESSDRTELRETFYLDTSGRASSLRVQVTATGREAEKWRRSLAQDGVAAFARQREIFYQQLFSGAQRAGKLEWHDDRENNELMLAEFFDLRDAVFSAPDGTSFVFRLRAHAIQSVLGFSESGQRRHPWEMRFSGRVRHIIEVESSGLPQNLARNARVDAKAFRLSCHTQQRSGFASITFLVQVLADHVPAAEFEIYKEKVREAWPYTVVMGQLPHGSIVPWKARASQNLLPRKSSRPAPPRAPASTDSAPAVASLGEIAPPLASKASREKATVVPRREKSPRPNEGPNVRERSSASRPNPGAVPPPLPNSAASEASFRRPRSRRRRRRQRERLLLWIGSTVGAAILFAMFLFLLHVK
jgi:hypothetical protein